MEGWEKQCQVANVDPAELIKKLAAISSYSSPYQYNTPSTYTQGATPFNDINASNAYSYIGQPQSPGLFQGRGGTTSWTGVGGKLQAWLDKKNIQNLQRTDPLLAQQASLRYQKDWAGQPGLISNIGNAARGMIDPIGAQNTRKDWYRANARRGRAIQIADMSAQGKDPSAIYGGTDYSSVNPFYNNPTK